MRQSRLKLTMSELMDLVVQVRDSMTYEKLKIGFEAFQKHAVNYFRITEGSEIEARVKMPEVYDVQLDIDFLSISTCTCLSSELCEHMAAVFFAVYQLHNQSPEGFMNECTAAMKELQSAQELQTSKAKKAQEKQVLERVQQEQFLQALQAIAAPSPIPVRQLVKQDPVHRKSAHVFTLQETSQVDEWHQHFQELYVSGSGQDEDADQIVRMLCSTAVSWESTMRELFETHARLFTLLKLEDRYHKIHQSHMYFLYESHLEEMAYTCLDDIAEHRATPAA